MNGNDNFQMYQNSGYTNNRNRKRTLILDVEDRGDTFLGTTGEFNNVELYVPLVIDKHSEVYLDNFTSYNSNLANDMDITAFSLKINEFNMNSNVASTSGKRTDPGTGRTTPGGQHMFNSLIIPNEHRNPDNFQTSVVHKGKKFNYVCDINPGTIHSLSGKITDLIGRPAFHDTSTGAFTYTIIGIDPALFVKLTETGRTGGNDSTDRTNINTSSDINGSVLAGQPITSFNIPLLGNPSTITNIDTGDTDAVIQPSGVTGRFIVNTSLTGSTITFTTTAQITNIGSTALTGDNTPISGVGDIYFQAGTENLGQAIRINNNVSGQNPAMAIIEGHGRFIAEFSIISRE